MRVSAEIVYIAAKRSRAAAGAWFMQEHEQGCRESLGLGAVKRPKPNEHRRRFHLKAVFK